MFFSVYFFRSEQRGPADAGNGHPYPIDKLVLQEPFDGAIKRCDGCSGLGIPVRPSRPRLTRPSPSAHAHPHLGIAPRHRVFEWQGTDRYE